MRWYFFSAIFFALIGCAAIPPAVIEKPEHLKPIQGLTDSSKLIFVANVSTKLINKKIGRMKGGTLCVAEQELLWKDNQAALNAIKESVSTTLSKNGYNIHSGLIQAGGEKDADILIGVGLEDIRANICYSIDGMKGEASMRLRFEILNNKTRSSFTKAATGSASIAEFSQTGDPDVFVRAAEMATENFLAEEAFFKATRK